MRTKNEVIEILQSAFLPLTCVAELHDYKKYIGFRIYGPNNESLLKFQDTPIDGFLSGSGLNTIIEAARQRIEKKGHKLNSLTLPSS